MKIEELLEVLNQPVDFIITKNTEKNLTAKFVIDDKRITFTANRIVIPSFVEDGKMDVDEWEIQFYEISGGKAPSYDKTGTGKEFQVFATIKKILEYLIKEKDVKALVFTATEKEKSRVRVYGTMLKRFKPAGFKIETGEDDWIEGTYFKLVRE
jgi:hypothetical protein